MACKRSWVRIPLAPFPDFLRVSARDPRVLRALVPTTNAPQGVVEDGKLRKCASSPNSTLNRPDPPHTLDSAETPTDQ